MSAHAAASPSSAAMWMNCPASITKAAGRTRPSSVYAREGTAAHAIAESLIGGDMFPPPKIDVEGDQFIVSKAMLRHLNGYVSFVEGLRDRGYQIFTEQRVKVSASGGWVWGTVDCYATGLDGHMHVIDLKYGKGVAVSPDTPQTKIYALGALDACPVEFWPQQIHLTIFQPRLDPQPQTKTLTCGELATWNEKEFVPAVQRLVDGDTTEKPGHHCRWCVRRQECVGYARRQSIAAAEIFADDLT
jgi:hypothetical protein